jgi:hypothetical protein
MPTVFCCWDPDFTGCRSGPCCPDVTNEENAVVLELATSMAVNILWALTGRQYGVCPTTVRPCKPMTCKPINLNNIVYWDSRLAQRGVGNLGVLGYIPTLVGGEVYNIGCGLCPVECCKCEPDCSVLLPGPVASVESVQVGGIELLPEDWILYEGGTLVFVNDTCPPCQDYNVANGEPGSWSVTYNIGVEVPPELNYAAGLLACEIAKSMIGDTSCALPDRVQSVARQGVDITFFDPIAFANEGLTGLPFVDMVIRSLNPNRLQSAPRVWSPDLPVIRREVTP